MSKRLLLTAATAAAALVGIAPTASAVDLHTQQGYRELGGIIAIQYDNYMPHKDGVDSSSGGHFYLSPEFGYFLIDGLELLTNFNLALGFGDRYGKDNTEVGFDIGLRYVIRMAAPIRPYVGIQFGMDFHVPDDSKLKTTKDFNLTVPIGLLIPLFNDYVAADIGLRVRYSISLEGDEGVDRFELPIGYLGVAAFW